MIGADNTSNDRVPEKYRVHKKALMEKGNGKIVKQCEWVGKPFKSEKLIGVILFKASHNYAAAPKKAV